MDINNCEICPHKCGVHRNKMQGLCGEGNNPRLALASLHFGEEPCISGDNGSGAVFFSGCSLSCCYCQNFEISQLGKGKEVSINRLADIFLKLQEQGANNINLVNPTHFAPAIAEALSIAKTKLEIPVIYNSSGYERIESLKLFDGLIDIYLPDLKYFDDHRALKYSKVDNYFQIASEAIKYMFESVGKIQLDSKGVLQKGLIIRHLILPKGHNDSLAILQWIADNFPLSDILVSIMSQYTPNGKNCDYLELNRKIYSYEYNKVIELADKLSIQGFMQGLSSAKYKYTPTFDFTGIM